MSRTRWMAAVAAALLLGSAARAQTPCPSATYCPGNGAREAARNPYYYEITQFAFPAPSAAVCPANHPVVWERLFEAVARQHTHACGVRQTSCESETGHHARRHAHDRHAISDLLELYCFYYRTGHYQAAEFVADRALQLDPGNVAAEAAVRVARMATDAQAHATPGCEDCETCESAPCAAAQECKECKGCCQASKKACCESCCGSTCSKDCCCAEKCACSKSSCACAKKCAKCACASSACACCKSSCGCAKSSCACAEKKCACAKATCGCGDKCACKGGSCACGSTCACKKSGKHKQKILHIRVSMPPMPMMMMCPGCPGMQTGMPHPMAGMMTPPMPPMPGLMPPPFPGMMPHPPIHVMTPGAPTWAAPSPSDQPEKLPMPEAHSPQDCTTETSSSPAEPRHGPIHVSVRDNQVHLTCPCLEACCNTVTSLPDGRALLDGDVTVIFHVDDRPAKIMARRLIVDLEDGSYEVNPARVDVPNIEPIHHEECLTSGCKQKPTCSEVVPTCPSSCGPHTPCSRDR